MSRFQYNIVPVPHGWQINCNGAIGSAYSEMTDAVLDTLAIAEQLRRQGHTVEVTLLQLDGVKRVLASRDARLFAR